MESLAKRNLDTTALTACILGLVTCPFPYIAIGALSHFAFTFSLTILPPFLIGSGFLLWRYRKLDTQNRAEVVSRGLAAIMGRTDYFPLSRPSTICHIPPLEWAHREKQSG